MLISCWLSVRPVAVLVTLLTACGGTPPEPLSTTALPPTSIAETTSTALPLTETPMLPDHWRDFATFVEQRGATGEFSGAILVAKDSEEIPAHADGLADRERTSANTIDTKFNIGSVGKTFTAVAIAQLVQVPIQR